MTAPAPTMVSVFDGRELARFILSRGKLGYEAVSLGLFPTQKEAVTAVMERSGPKEIPSPDASGDFQAED
jgi:hypothetical protein